MNCLECRGACCEEFTTDMAMTHGPKYFWPERQWLSFHATRVEGAKFTFEVRCQKLTPEGRCEIWEDRPIICEVFAAGSKPCLDVVRRRRTPEDYLRIREEGDPPDLTVS